MLELKMYKYTSISVFWKQTILKKNKWILLTWIHYLYWCGCNKVK